MGYSISLRELTFSGGESVALEPDSIIVLVGPNNVGKSASLREIVSQIRDRDPVRQVVSSLKIRHLGDSGAFLESLAPYRMSNPASGISPYYIFSDISGWDSPPGMQPWPPAGVQFVDEYGLERFWKNEQYPFWLGNFFVHLADVGSRLQVTDPAPVFNVATESPTHPIQQLYADDQVANRVSANFRHAFGQGLVVNRGAGALLPLHCGDEPLREDGEDRVSPSYIKKLAKLPVLQRQGDGMRSFAGCLLQATVTSKFVVLLDEPEAFLHPPQARLLGRILAKQKPPDRQLVVATHSGDFLRGLLDANPDAVKIIRLTRDGNVNHARELDTDQVRRLWSDPVLRFSNALDGLFHERVVLCEADGDCRFYSAVLDAVIGERLEHSPDVMFSSTGGKHKVPAIAAALARIGVLVQAALDFDVLNDISPLRDVVEALGGAWATFEKSWRQIKSGVEKRRPERDTSQVRDEIRKTLDSVNSPVFPDVEAKRIQDVLKKVSPWEEAKRVGLGAVPSGQERRVAEQLLEDLKRIGLFVVDCGELESFDPTIGGHGNLWVAEVLRKDLKEDARLENARRFVRELVPAPSVELRTKKDV